MKKCSNDPSLSDTGLFNDPYLVPYHAVILQREKEICEYVHQLTASAGDLLKFSDYHEKFGLFFEKGSWLFREWAPNAEQIYILCEKSQWRKTDRLRLNKIDDEVFEGRFDGSVFSHGDLYRFCVTWPGGEGDRIPTAARRVVQDAHSHIFNAQVWQPPDAYHWKHAKPSWSGPPLLIYEAHVGMALEEGRVGTYAEFEQYILPKIKAAGYNTLQLMAVLEHPYYGSFGYHVSQFFAPSSRFGTPDELKSLVDAAHGCGMTVLMDMVHSHAVNNEVEGLSRFDGTLYQFFHDGPKGHHALWDSRCFNYGKKQVIRFLLSTLKYWIEDFRFDGFRFDGITSMLFEDHGIGRSFTSYSDYYTDGAQMDALAYLRCANAVIHQCNPAGITIAEDVSGYPGLAAPVETGGFGFDFRYAMGISDFWIKLLKDYKDEQWPLGTLWHELTTRRKEEQTISYAESHDQALVGDKTLMMHLMGPHIYDAMHKERATIETVRAVALHKMIRLITLAAAGSGYLNFMGNEFGHPEWIDFPSLENNFSFDYARRQWSLKYNTDLYFSDLSLFDAAMIRFVKDNAVLFSFVPSLCHLHENDRVIAFERGPFVFIFSFNADHSFEHYGIDAKAGAYQMIFNSDDIRFGGNGRLVENQTHFTISEIKGNASSSRLSVYLPTRTALVLKHLN